MMIVTNADNLTYENSRVFNIDRIVLGYARIYEPSTDAHTGLLVPVWDFFGSRKIDSNMMVKPTQIRQIGLPGAFLPSMQ